MEKECERAADGKEKQCEENMEGEANTWVIEGGLEGLVGHRQFPFSCVWCIFAFKLDKWNCSRKGSCKVQGVIQANMK